MLALPCVLPQPRYPFPSLISPHAESIKAETEHWLDVGYEFLPQKLRQVYKLSNFGYITARCLPHIRELSHLRPAARFMLWGTLFDDYFEYKSEDELKAITRRLESILLGNQPDPGEHPFFHILVIIRDELLSFMPATWFSRFSSHAIEYCASMQLEVPFKDQIDFKPPPLKDFLQLRELTIGCQAFHDLIDIEIGSVMSDDTMCSEKMKKLYSLSARLFAWCNDFFSLEKDLGREPLNLVFVLQHERQLSLDDACNEAMALHDDDLREFIQLCRSMKDPQEMLFADYLGIMIQGQSTWYEIDTQRYKLGGSPGAGQMK